MSTHRALVNTFLFNRCKSLIKFQKTQIKIGGLAIPIKTESGGTVIEMGNVDLTPAKIRDTITIIEALDLLQYTACQDIKMMNKVGDKDMVAWLFKRKYDAIDTLIKLAGDLSVSNSKIKLEKSIKEAKGKGKDLNKMKPPKG